MLALAATARAEENEFERFVDTGLQGVTLAAPAVRLLARDPVKRETGRRMLDATLFTAAAAQGLKYAVDSSRPYGGAHGFPSGHTALAFAVATSLYEREPETGWFSFPVAALIGWMRVDMNTHDWLQVVAGAAIGAYAGHMCGEGQWRLLGHNDKDLPAEARSVAPEPTWETPVSAGARKGFVVSTTVWRTEF
jgi:membrane-associated phospholipid phosphatase